MHDIQFNKAHHGKLLLFILFKSNISISFPEMIGYPFTLTPPSSSEDSPQSFNMHSPNHYILPQPYIISATPQYEMSMTSMYNSEMKPPYLTIVEQPIDKFRFRYKSEMAGTHGSLTGINSDKTRKQTYPTVKLNNFFERDAIIRCSLYQNGSSDDRQPHAHRLIMKHGHEERDDPHDLLVTKDNGYEASFHSMGIIHTAKKHIVGELKRKKTLLKLEEVARLDKIKRNLSIKEEVEIGTSADEECKSINLNIVCLRFDAFRRENDILYPICKPIYSHAINNLKSALTGELKIVRMDHSSSPAKGNREIFMLVEKVTKKNIKIRFFELDEEENEMWSEYGKFNDLDVHHQYAIVFRTPPYKDLNIDEQKKVFIELERPSDGSRSEPREFTYIPSSQNYKTGMKRPRTSMYSSSEYSSSSLNSAEIPTTLEALQNGCEVTSADLHAALENIDSDEFRKIFYENYTEFNGLQTDCGRGLSKRAPNTEEDKDRIIVDRVVEEYQDFMKSKPKNDQILHMLQSLFTKYVNDAKENALHIVASEGNLKMLRYFLNIISIHKLYTILNLRNSNMETIAHLALQQSNVDVITTILKYQCDLSAKDINGNTPLHVAIIRNQSNIVIDTLLRSPYGTDLFINAENNDNFTALHMAIKMNKVKYVDLLYKYGVNVNLIDKKTGRNSLHIAIAEQATEIVKLLLEKTTIDILKEDFSGRSPLNMAKHLTQDKEPERIQIYNMIEKALKDRGIHTECVIKEEIESEEEMEVEMVECKFEKLAIDELETMYKNATSFTSLCLEKVSRILDVSQNWLPLADLLDLKHFVHTNMIAHSKSKSRNSYRSQ
ncbi:nuclear factor nf-kappa-b protein [Holotrichia oblita]|uniref:Nuclear factor nf-kappa-b protein n=1 Tax=Holotrichia oblita TaxID=644536 RepID=A0ACB9SYD7_HOLOL|nr:nuclear factor nf-kappa-b protein [Holotrichia oblita]